MSTEAVERLRLAVAEAVEGKKAAFHALPSGGVAEVWPRYKDGKLARIDVRVYNPDSAAREGGSSP